MVYATGFINNEKETKKWSKSLVSFFFPLFPIKIMKSQKLMFFIALLLSLRLVLSMISIKIPMFNLTIGVSWVPVMIFGWHFGMVYGFIFGVITDTLCFYIFPSGALWFWMYAIQEPSLCFFAGFIGSICRLRQNSNSRHYYLDIILFQLSIICFVVASYAMLLTFTWHDAKIDQGVKDYIFLHHLTKYISLGVLLAFFVFCELFFWLWIAKNKNSSWHNILNFIYSSMLVIILITLFSFALGPFITVGYFKYTHLGKEPNNYIKYGLIFYLIPRFIEQSIKVPIESLVLASSIILSQRYLKQSIMHSIYQWNV